MNIFFMLLALFYFYFAHFHLPIYLLGSSCFHMELYEIMNTDVKLFIILCLTMSPSILYVFSFRWQCILIYWSFKFVLIQAYPVFLGDFFFLLCLKSLLRVGVVICGSHFTVFELPSYLGTFSSITSSLSNGDLDLTTSSTTLLWILPFSPSRNCPFTWTFTA